MIGFTGFIIALLSWFSMPADSLKRTNLVEYNKKMDFAAAGAIVALALYVINLVI